MDENLKVSADYKKWFNRGYRLREQFPDIFKTMVTPKDEPKEITQAFEAGAKEFERKFGYDREKENLKQQYRKRGKERTNAKNRKR